MSVQIRLKLLLSYYNLAGIYKLFDIYSTFLTKNRETNGWFPQNNRIWLKKYWVEYRFKRKDIKIHQMFFGWFFIYSLITVRLKVMCIIMADRAPRGSLWAIASATARCVMMVSSVSFLCVILTNIRTAVSMMGISCSTTLFLEHRAMQVWKAMSSSI